MASNDILQELLIDVFDDKVAFSYAYWYQYSLNSDLIRLEEIANEAALAAEQDVEMLALPERLRNVRHSVVNDLYNGIRGDGRKISAEKYMGEWYPAGVVKKERLGASEVAGQFLLWQSLFSKLERELPPAVKICVTLEQVSAIAREAITDNTSILKLPVHLPSLATAMHTLIIERHTTPTSESEFDPERQMQIAFERYLNLARRATFELVKAQFHDQMFAKFQGRAQALDISIDRYFPWGALVDRPTPVSILLIELACLINQGDISYGRWKKNDFVASLLGKIPAKNYIILSDEPRVRPRSISGPIYFSSERSSLVVDGIPLQNQLALVLPYDRPFAELDQSLERFKKYYLRQVATYRADLGQPGAMEKERRAREEGLIPEPKVELVILERSSSIPKHLVALRSLEPDRPSEEGKPKSLRINIYEEFNKLGFSLKQEAVDNALDNAVRWQQKVVDKLNQWC